MTMDANEQIISLLTEILAELRKAPVARAPAASGAKKTDAHNGTLVPPDADWARFKWPPFCDKMGYLAKRNEVTIGDSIRTEGGRKSTQYWIDKFEIKSDRDRAFRAALDAARDWLASPSSSPEAAGAAPSRPAAPPDRSPQYNPGPADSEEIPF